jgi:hypothetical protein
VDRFRCLQCYISRCSSSFHSGISRSRLRFGFTMLLSSAAADSYWKPPSWGQSSRWSGSNVALLPDYSISRPTLLGKHGVSRGLLNVPQSRSFSLIMPYHPKRNASGGNVGIHLNLKCMHSRLKFNPVITAIAHEWGTVFVEGVISPYYRENHIKK